MKVRLAVDQRSLTLELGDEGQGLPPTVLEEIAKGTGELGVGIAGMRERVKQFGGSLKVDSTNSGTLVTVMFPFGKTSTRQSKRGEA